MEYKRAVGATGASLRRRGLGVTSFPDSTAGFQTWMVGWTIMLDVQKPSFLTVFAVPDRTAIEVRGDASGLAGIGATYRVIAPPGVDPTTGAQAKPENMLSNRADSPGCGYLWSGYQYIPPQVGHESGGSTTGAQGGISKLGSYHCWNRVYDVFTGRWTTPDPAMSPWVNLFDYVGLDPIASTDSTGLVIIREVPNTWSLKRCGELYVEWDFELETGNHKGGYFIAKITFWRELCKCNGGCQVWTETYWEAWKVDAGRTRWWLRNGERGVCNARRRWHLQRG